MSGRRFEVTEPLRFAECDPAGIAFYPRLVERVNNVIEDWFAGPIGVSFADMHLDGGPDGQGKVGVPTRTLNLEFLAPGRLGDPLTLALEVESLGRASIALNVTATLGDGTVMFTAHSKLVWCRFEPDRVQAVAIPEWVRRRMAPFQTGDPDLQEA
jgi:4-hydroxybenzoyl-CoA thioesterase